MNSTKLASISLAGTLAVTLPTALAHAAGVGRTFVSAAGSDSNNCANVATPCRHLAAAYAATAPNGEIYVLDPANYGSLTITQGVSIEGHGWASIAPVSGGNAITINALPLDKINIIGVVLDGTALANTTGIQFNAGGSLIVRDSVIRNFTGDGIDFKPNSESDLVVSNTLVSHNGDTGIAVFPSDAFGHTVTINRVEITDNNQYGVFLWGSPSTGPMTATIFESIFSGSSFGVYALTDASHATVQLSVFHSVATRNHTGLRAEGQGATILTANSMSTGNGFPWEAANSGVVQSYGDSYLIGNAFDLPAPPLVSKQ